MGMSYRRAWKLVEALNAAYKSPVVVTAVGGEKGGGARVTPHGRRLAAAFRAMEAKASKAIAADLKRELQSGRVDLFRGLLHLEG